MLASIIKAMQARTQSNKPLVGPGFYAFMLLMLSALALGSIVLGVFLLAGNWGFIALGVALVLFEWRIDSDAR